MDSGSALQVCTKWAENVYHSIFHFYEDAVGYYDKVKGLKAFIFRPQVFFVEVFLIKSIISPLN